MSSGNARTRLTAAFPFGWRDGNGDLAQKELYDHAADREESVNVAPERSEVVERLMKQMQSQPRLVS